ncbi:hypothetical protein DIPPA_32969 [Diplonema papillatum]|nr:hypothetical protein DIPPA_32969 [Diplonema papillatum]
MRLSGGCPPLRRALIVGVDGAGGGGLAGAAREAESLAAYLSLRDLAGDVQVLTDIDIRSQKLPTRDRILRGVDWLVAEHSTEQQSLLFVFAGRPALGDSGLQPLDDHENAEPAVSESDLRSRFASASLPVIAIIDTTPAALVIAGFPEALPRAFDWRRHRAAGHADPPVGLKGNVTLLTAVPSDASDSEADEEESRGEDAERGGVLLSGLLMVLRAHKTTPPTLAGLLAALRIHLADGLHRRDPVLCSTHGIVPGSLFDFHAQMPAAPPARHPSGPLDPLPRADVRGYHGSHQRIAEADGDHEQAGRATPSAQSNSLHAARQQPDTAGLHTLNSSRYEVHQRADPHADTSGACQPSRLFEFHEQQQADPAAHSVRSGDAPPHSARQQAGIARFSNQNDSLHGSHEADRTGGRQAELLPAERSVADGVHPETSRTQSSRLFEIHEQQQADRTAHSTQQSVHSARQQTGRARFSNQNKSVHGSHEADRAGGRHAERETTERAVSDGVHEPAERVTFSVQSSESAASYPPVSSKDSSFEEPAAAGGAADHSPPPPPAGGGAGGETAMPPPAFARGAPPRGRLTPSFGTVPRPNQQPRDPCGSGRHAHEDGGLHNESECGIPSTTPAPRTPTRSGAAAAAAAGAESRPAGGWAAAAIDMPAKSTPVVRKATRGATYDGTSPLGGEVVPRALRPLFDEREPAAARGAAAFALHAPEEHHRASPGRDVDPPTLVRAELEQDPPLPARAPRAAEPAAKGAGSRRGGSAQKAAGRKADRPSQPPAAAQLLQGRAAAAPPPPPPSTARSSSTSPPPSAAALRRPAAAVAAAAGRPRNRSASAAAAAVRKTADVPANFGPWEADVRSSESGRSGSPLADLPKNRPPPQRGACPPGKAAGRASGLVEQAMRPLREQLQSRDQRVRNAAGRSSLAGPSAARPVAAQQEGIEPATTSVACQTAKPSSAAGPKTRQEQLDQLSFTHPNSCLLADVLSPVTLLGPQMHAVYNELLSFVDTVMSDTRYKHPPLGERLQQLLAARSAEAVDYKTSLSLHLSKMWPAAKPSPASPPPTAAAAAAAAAPQQAGALYFAKELRTAADRILAEYHAPSAAAGGGEGALAPVRVALVGGKDSGKTTFLRVLAERALFAGGPRTSLSADVGGETLVAALNFAACVPRDHECLGPPTFYAQTVSSVIFVWLDSLFAHRPWLRQWHAAVCLFWKRVVTGVPSLPKKFADAFPIVAHAWQKEAGILQQQFASGSYQALLSHVFCLPATAFFGPFEFRRVSFVLDGLSSLHHNFGSLVPVLTALSSYPHASLVFAAANDGPFLKKIATLGLRVVPLSDLISTASLPGTVPTRIRCEGKTFDISVFGGCPGYLSCYLNMLSSRGVCLEGRGADSEPLDSDDDTQHEAEIEFFSPAILQLLTNLQVLHPQKGDS